MKTINESFDDKEMKRLQLIKKKAALQLMNKKNISWKKFIKMSAEALHDFQLSLNRS